MAVSAVKDVTKTYQALKSPVDSSGSFTYLWKIFLSDGVTESPSVNYAFQNETTATNTSIDLRFLTTGTFVLKVSTTQSSTSCNVTKESTININVVDGAGGSGCFTYGYGGGTSGGTITYSLCGGGLNEQLTVSPYETGSFCIKENSATFTDTVNLTKGNNCGQSSMAQVRQKGFYVSVWGNGGNTLTEFDGQGTHNDECFMLSDSRFTEALPFFGTRTGVTRTVKVSDWWFNPTNNRREERFPKLDRIVTVDYLITTSVMDEIIEYMVRAGVQGFNFLFYSNSSILKQWRQMFVAAQNKRGLDYYYYIEQIHDGGFNSYPDNSVYATDIETIASEMYTLAYKKKNGRPVLGYGIAQHQIVDPDFIAKMNTNISRIKERYRIISENPSAELYLVAQGIPYLENDNWFKNVGGFNSHTQYYIYGDYTNNDFQQVLDMTAEYVQGRTLKQAKFILPLTMGLDSRAREWFYSGGASGGGDPGSKFYSVPTLLEKLPNLINYALDQGNNEFLDWYSINMADENTEQMSGGYGFIPTLNKYNIKNTEINKIFKNILNPNY